MGDEFAAGQAYVMLSRVMEEANLRILELRPLEPEMFTPAPDLWRLLGYLET
jgi:hypothetical protein